MILRGFLLDTSTISALRYKNHSLHQRVKTWRDAFHEESLHISAVTVAEIETGLQLASPGALPGKRAKEIRKFMSNCMILDVDKNTSRIYGRIRAELFQRHGPRDSRGNIKTRWVEDLREFTVAKPLGIQDGDLWIVSTAIQYNLEFVTLDLGGGMKNIVDAASYNQRTVFLEP